MLKKMILLLFVLFMFLIHNGCMNLTIDMDVDFPAELFAATKKKIDIIHMKDPHRKGTVSNLNIWIYVGDERKLVSFSLPKETVQKALAGEFAGQKNVQDISKKVGQVEWKKLKNLDRFGPGLILEVEVEEDDVHLLIWLD